MTVTQVWSGPDDFERAVSDALALFEPEQELAPVLDIRSGERVR